MSRTKTKERPEVLTVIHKCGLCAVFPDHPRKLVRGRYFKCKAAGRTVQAASNACKHWKDHLFFQDIEKGS